ncbi:MAG: hypothetical protein RLO06_09110 [Parvibaculum sp.]
MIRTHQAQRVAHNELARRRDAETIIGVAQVMEEEQRAAEHAARPLREMTAELGR